MTLWEFLDRLLARFRVEHVAGAGVFALTMLVFAMIYAEPELAKDDLFKTLAQAVIVQGLVGLAMAAWFTKKHGDGAEPVQVVNSDSDPVPVAPPDVTDAAR